MKRAKLLLFSPFRDEMEEIHSKDIEDLYNCKIKIIGENQAKFENMNASGKKMNDILNEIEKQREENKSDDEGNSEDEYDETTTADEMKDFQKDF